MRSTGSGPLGALLMLAPLIAVPILAVVGIPQFAPGNLLDTQSSNSGSSGREHRTPLEPRYGDDARHDADDLFAPLEDASDLDDEFEDPLKPRKPIRKKGRVPDSDAFGLDDDASRFDDTDNPDEGLGENEPDASKSDPGFDSGLSSFDSPNPGRRRPGSRNPGLRNDLSDEKRYADISDPSSGDSGLDSDTGGDANPFELPADGPVRPGVKKRPSPSAFRDPNDAPIFEPATPPDQDVDENEDEAPVAPPISKSAPGRGLAPRTQPAEPPEESPSVEPDNAAEQPEDLTWQVATKRLRAMGVGKSKQHFTYIEDRDVFLFTCSAVRLNDPTKTKRFEAEADEPLLAVRQVLEELELWQASGAKPRTRPRTSVADRQ